MLNFIIWGALTMSIGTGILAVWVFNHLVSGGVIIGDKYNEAELIASVLITVLVVVALIPFTVRILRR